MKKTYPDLKIFKLEQNYRSTKSIVSVANSVIKYNTLQLPKEIWTKNKKGEDIKLLKAVSDIEEGKLVAYHISEEKMKHNLSNNDFAILYRINAQSRSPEEALRKCNIKYRIIKGLSFYDRKEIKDLIAYLRFVVNTNDIEAFKRSSIYLKEVLDLLLFKKLFPRL